jgi:hypothetical protein
MVTKKQYAEVERQSLARWRGSDADQRCQGAAGTGARVGCKRGKFISCSALGDAR